MTPAPPLVMIRDLCKSYQRGDQLIPVLENLSLDIPAGEFLALMGPSGSGKSTLLNLIAGIDSADSGRIEIGGIDILPLSERELARWRAGRCAVRPPRRCARWRPPRWGRHV